MVRYRLDGRIALVTGAAGDIGSATASLLAAEGARVVLADRDGAGVNKVADTIRGAGHHAIAAECDQTDPAAVQRLFEDVIGGHLDICVANAGYGRFATVLDQDLDEWRRHIDVNLTGTFLMCQNAARTMAARGRGGSIIINASTAALRSCTLFAAYAASKAGAEMLARCLADELGPLGIRVNTVCPGVIHTGMTGGILSSTHGETQAMIEAETPLGRVGHPQDVARTISFLASDDAAYITGTALLIDGGQTLRGLPRWFINDQPDSAAPKWRLVAARPKAGGSVASLGIGPVDNRI